MRWEDHNSFAHLRLVPLAIQAVEAQLIIEDAGSMPQIHPVLEEGDHPSTSSGADDDEPGIGDSAHILGHEDVS